VFIVRGENQPIILGSALVSMLIRIEVFNEPKGGAGSWEPNQCRSTFPTGIRIQDRQMNADPDPQHYLKRRDQRAFNLRNWRTSVYSTAYYIFFCSSAAGWHVRVRYVSRTCERASWSRRSGPPISW
jgi:hypothetical protein